VTKYYFSLHGEVNAFHNTPVTQPEEQFVYKMYSMAVGGAL